MEVIVKPIKQTVEVSDNGTTVDLRVVRNVVDVTAPGPQGAIGPQGPQGEPGGSEIGGYPVQITDAQNLDILQFQSQKWVNNPQSNLTDGGNF